MISRVLDFLLLGALCVATVMDLILLIVIISAVAFLSYNNIP